MGRLDALRNINRDAALKEEILTRISDDAAIAESLAERAPTGPTGAAPGGTLEESRVIVPQVTVDAARSLIEDPPDQPVDFDLEAIILVMGRPVLLVRNDDVDLATLETDTWRARLEQARPGLKSAILSVGRIDLDNNPQFDWVGTGWVVADDVIVTNRHVASEFARREGDRFTFRTSFLGQMGARVDFKEEFEGPAPDEFRVAEILHIEAEPGPDMAFLRVDWGSGARRAPIRLAPSTQPGRGIVVIGYPAKDTRTSIPAEMDRIFGAVYNVKRLAPGDVTAVREQEQLVNHDCTTLGGNSGSVVLDLETGEAVALHFAGRERDRNFAVPARAVRARLEELLGAVPTPRTGTTGPQAEAEKAPTLADMEGRTGYQQDFLGPAVAHPALRPEVEGALAPVTGREDGILDYTHYSLRMHRFRRLAMYTAVNIDGGSARNVRRGRDKWSMDPRIDPRFQVGNELYERNKLDRGHLVRRLDPAWGDTFESAEAAALDTFFYTNCAPQHQRHNQDLWLGIEDHILSNADARDLRVNVFSGPIFRDSDRQYREFLIPEDYWKVVAVVNDETGRLSVTGYVVSQRDFMDDLEFAFGPFQTYQVPVATIEEQTRLDFGDLKDFDPLAGTETSPIRPLTTLADITL
ncbi:MAG TPA: DNA/RNA non-specific endonuclease [Jiangellaceae bacterium]|nr:DNA/RNA non-specific endonuclease [Jiangellaceae bacterium]